MVPLQLAGIGAALGLTSIQPVNGAIIIVLVIIAWIVTGKLGEAGGDKDDIISGIVAFIIALIVALVMVDHMAISLMIIAAGVIVREVTVVVALGQLSGIAGGVSVAIAVSGGVLLAGGLEGGGQVIFAGIVAIVSAVILGYGVMQTLNNVFETGEPNFWSRPIFISLALSYAALVWIYLLGGWQVIFDLQSGG